MTSRGFRNNNNSFETREATTRTTIRHTQAQRDRTLTLSVLMGGGDATSQMSADTNSDLASCGVLLILSLVLLCCVWTATCWLVAKEAGTIPFSCRGVCPWSSRSHPGWMSKRRSSRGQRRRFRWIRKFRNKKREARNEKFSPLRRASRPKPRVEIQSCLRASEELSGLPTVTLHHHPARARCCTYPTTKSYSYAFRLL